MSAVWRDQRERKEPEPNAVLGRKVYLETVPAFSLGGAGELLLRDLPALSFLETYCLPRPARPQAPGRNVTSCNVAITDKHVPERGTPARGALEGLGGLCVRPRWCV